MLTYKQISLAPWGHLQQHPHQLPATTPPPTTNDMVWPYTMDSCAHVHIYI